MILDLDLASPRWRQKILALVVLSAGTLSVLSPILPFDPRESMPTNATTAAYQTDQIWVTWAVARGARAWLAGPQDFFETRACFPTPTAVALGEHVATLSLVAAPAEFLFGNPILTHNWGMLSLVVLSFVAMTLLVHAWSGNYFAALAAATLYAFGSAKIADFAHPYVNDTAWLVFGLYFAWKYVTQGRARDCLLCAGFCSLQLGTSLYPIVTSVLLAIPLATWLIATYGIRRIRPLPAVVGIVALLAVATFLFSPYLALGASSELLNRGASVFAAWPLIYSRYTGLTLCLVVAGLLLPRRLALPGAEGPLRWALVAALLLTALITSEIELFSRNGEAVRLYDLLASVIPGLSAIRVPRLIAQDAVHVVLPLLAGMGIAGLLSWIPSKFRNGIAVAVLLLVFVDTLRPAALGLTPKARPWPLSSSPLPSVLADYEQLSTIDGEGPLLHLPFVISPGTWRDTTATMLLSEYHGRAVAACYNSYYSKETRRVEELASRLPYPAALLKLRAKGFETLIVPQTERKPEIAMFRALSRLARRNPDLIRHIYAGQTLDAFSIVATGESRKGSSK